MSSLFSGRFYPSDNGGRGGGSHPDPEKRGVQYQKICLGPSGPFPGSATAIALLALRCRSLSYKTSLAPRIEERQLHNIIQSIGIC